MTKVHFTDIQFDGLLPSDYSQSAFIDGKAIATVQVKRSTDRSDAPDYQVYDTNGAFMFSFNSGDVDCHLTKFVKVRLANHLNAGTTPETGFDKPIQEAIESGNLAIAQRMATEKRIASKLVEIILSRGHAVSVYDGESYILRSSMDKTAILAVMFSTDSDTLTFEHNGRKAGFWLVYGNDGFDVISDYTANAECEAISALVTAAMPELI